MCWFFLLFSLAVAQYPICIEGQDVNGYECFDLLVQNVSIGETCIRFVTPTGDACSKCTSCPCTGLEIITTLNKTSDWFLQNVSAWIGLNISNITDVYPFNCTITPCCGKTCKIIAPLNVVFGSYILKKICNKLIFLSVQAQVVYQNDTVSFNETAWIAGRPFPYNDGYFNHIFTECGAICKSVTPTPVPVPVPNPTPVPVPVPVPVPTPTPVSPLCTNPLQNASSFGLLAAGNITVYENNFVKGNVGVYPGDIINEIGVLDVAGNIYLGESVAQNAQTNALNAYNFLTSLACGVSFTEPVVWVNIVLTPGVYCFNSLTIEGNLTLNGLGTFNPNFIFIINGSLKLGESFNLIAVNNTAPCGIYFLVSGNVSLIGDIIQSSLFGYIVSKGNIVMDQFWGLTGSLISLQGDIELKGDTIGVPAFPCGNVCNTSIPTLCFKPLGSANSFALLAGDTITNTGNTSIFGNVGTYPGDTLINSDTLIIDGDLHMNDTVSNQAHVDALEAYDFLLAFPCTTTYPIPIDFTNVTFTPGTYCFDSFVTLFGTITLDGLGNPNASFIFKFNSSLQTVEASVILTNGTQACSVYWVVKDFVNFHVINTPGVFAGTVLAKGEIKSDQGYLFEGSLISLEGNIKLEGNFVIGSSATCGINLCNQTILV